MSKESCVRHQNSSVSLFNSVRLDGCSCAIAIELNSNLKMMNSEVYDNRCQNNKPEGQFASFLGQISAS